MTTTMTRAALHASGILPITCELFNNRHIRHTDRETGESLFRTCTPTAVAIAHENLRLLDTSWPTREAAPAQSHAIQRELDIILRKHYD